MNEKKILIINQGGSDNLGDQAINESLTMLLTQYEYKTYFQDFTTHLFKYSFTKPKNNGKNIIKSIIKFFIPTKIRWYLRNKKIFEILSNKKFDAVIIGGGQLINKNKIFSYALKLWVKKIKKHPSNPKLFMFAVGAMDNFSYADKKIYKTTLKKFDEIYVRDEYSQKSLLSNFNIKSKLTHDVAFTYKKHKISDKISKVKNSVLIGFTGFERHRKYNKNISYKQYLRGCKNKMLELQTKYKDITLFYTTVSDFRAVNIIKNEIKNNENIKIAKIEKLADLIYYLNMTETVISPRMHALILGKIYDCNVIPELLSDKISTFSRKYLNKNFDLTTVINKIENDLKSMLSFVA